DRATDGRASSAKPALSLSIIATWKPLISKKAYLSLSAKIAPHLRSEAPFRAMRLILSAYVQGAISSWMLLSLVGHLVHPALREWAYGIRQTVGRLFAAGW